MLSTYCVQALLLALGMPLGTKQMPASWGSRRAARGLTELSTVRELLSALSTWAVTAACG